MAALYNLSHFAEEKSEIILLYLSRDKDFIVVANNEHPDYEIYIVTCDIFLFLEENTCCGYSLEAPR